MTLLGMDGLTDAVLMPKNAWDVAQPWQNGTATGRSGDTNGAATAPGGTSAFKTYTLPSAAATVIYGVASNVNVVGVFSSVGAGTFALGAMMVGGVVQCIVGLNSSGFIEVRRGATWTAGTIIATSTGHTAISTGAWHQAQVKGLMHTSAGQVIVKLDGVQVLDTGVLQTAATAGSVSALRFGAGNSSTNGLWYDDFYVCDAVDATANPDQLRPNNDFLGDLKVLALAPTGPGDVTQWTPNTAVANWTTVDETPPSATDYNSDATAGHQDLYALGDLTGTIATVFAVQESLYVAKSDVGSAQVKPLIKENSVATSEAGQGLSTTAGPVFGALRAVRPSDGGLWTSTDVNALQAGAEVA